MSNCIREQLKKLISFSDSEDEWESSKYGKTLKMVNDETREVLQSVWRVMLNPPSTNLSSFDELKIRRARHTCPACDATTVSFQFDQCCGAKTYFVEWQDLPTPITYFLWNHGILEPSSAGPIHFNPLLSYSQFYGKTFLQHQDVSPYLGFHLSSALPSDPKRLLYSADKTARSQFRKWIAAVRRRFQSGRIQLRFAVCDPISFAAANHSTDVNLYSRPWSIIPLRVETRKFNVIEMGYVIDRVGFLNLAPFVIPVLKPRGILYCSSYNVFLDGETVALETILCGDVGIMSTLLGIVPFEYTTGVTTRGYIQDAVHSTNPLRRVDVRIPWRHGPAVRPHFNATQLAKFLFDVFRRMFAAEFINLDADVSSNPTKHVLNTYYTKRSFTTLLRFLQGRLYGGESGRDWGKLARKLLEQLSTHYAAFAMLYPGGDNEFVSLLQQQSALQEIISEWNFSSLITPNGILPVEQPIPITRASPISPVPVSFNSYRPEYGFLRRQRPACICALVLNIPSSTVKVIKSVMLGRHITVTLNVVLTYEDRSCNVFRAIHPVFGRLTTSSDGETGSIEEDVDGWYGSAELHLCLYLPTSVCFRDDPRQILVSAFIGRDRATLECFQHHFGPSLEIFKERLLDMRHVHVFESLPNLRKPKSLPPIPSTDQTSAVTTSNFEVLFPRLEPQKREFVQCINFKAKGFEPVKVVQISPTTVRLTCALGEQLCTFPFPVTNIRHAVKLSAVEITASLVSPSDHGMYTSEPFPHGEFNLSYVNFERMETIDWKNVTLWMNGFLLSMFSDREIRCRGRKSDLWTNVKNTIHVFFAQLPNGVLRLVPEKPDDSPLIFFISDFYSDFNSHSLVADAYVLQVTPDLQSPTAAIQAVDLKVDDQQMKFWRNALPALVERCRTWNHTTTCQHNEGTTSLCPYGMGKVDSTFEQMYSKYSRFTSRVTRFALSPLFTPAYVEGTRQLMNTLSRGSLEKLDIFQYMGPLTEKLNLENPGSKFRCRVCGKEAPNKCSRCQKARYCSKTCQAADWKIHKPYCIPA